MTEQYRSHAEKLAHLHAKTGNLQSVYLFPDPSEEEIRLVEIDPTTIPSKEGMTAWHFGKNTVGQIPYRVAIAVIRPEEEKSLDPPRGWVSWESAEKIKIAGIKPVRRK